MKNIPHHSATDSRQHANQGRREGGKPESECFLSAGDGEERQARRIENKNGIAQFGDPNRPIERDQTGQQRHGHISPVVDRSWWHRSD